MTMRQTLRTSWLRTWLACWTLALAFAAAPARCQDWDPRGFEHQERAFDAMGRAAYAQAEEALLDQLRLQPTNFVPWYNLACARCMQGKQKTAWDALERAIELGFDKPTLLERDPQLECLRDDPRMLELVMDFGRVRLARADAIERQLRARYPKGYTFVRDDRLRLVYASAFSQTAFDQARREIDLLAEWASNHVFSNLPSPPVRAPAPAAKHGSDGKGSVRGQAGSTEEIDEGSDALGDAYVSVVLPNRKDFLRWAISLYGPDVIGDTSQIGGSYLHDRKELVSMDLGSSLRHEFFHVLHWRSNERSGHVHAIWVQEGLCSLVEDFDVVTAGEGAATIRITPSIRTNIARRLARANGLMAIEKLAQLSREQFTGNRPLAHYAQARTFFFYLWTRGQLRDFLDAYDETFTEDPSGVAAIRAVLGDDLVEANRAYRAFVRDLPEVSEVGRVPAAALGLDTDAGTGEGLTVKAVRNRSSGDLARRDIIIAIDDRPVRDVNELYRVLGDYDVGDEVTVTYLRKEQTRSTTVRLQAASR